MTTRNPSRSHAVFDDIVWGAHHDAFDSDLGQSLIRAWSVGAADDQIRHMIHQLVRPLRVQEAFGNLVPFRSPHLGEGDILLGRDHMGHEVRIPLQSLVAGLLVAANTGGGKSVLLSHLLLQIAAGGCRFWVSEMYKSQIRQLLPLFKHGGTDLVVLRARDWKFNLLQVNETDPRNHLPVVVDLLMRRLDLPPRARTLLQQDCHSLYQRFGIWAGRTDAYPCLFDLYESAMSRTQANAAAREALLDRLGPYLSSLTPGCGAFRKAWSAIDLSHFPIVFEMRGSSELVKQLLLEPVLYSLLQHQLEHGAVNAAIDLFVAFEDSQRFFDSSSRGGGQTTPIDELASVIRGTGRGLAVIVQTMRGLSPRIIPNLATKIMGRLGSNEDYQRLGADLGLTPQQREWARLNLRPGRFIVQVADGSWRHPFLLNVPLVKSPFPVSDEDVKASARVLDSLPVVPAPEFARWEPRHLIKLANSTSPRTPSRPSFLDMEPGTSDSTRIKRREVKRFPLTKEELDFLQDVSEHPFDTTRQRNKRLGLSAWKGNRLRSGLASKGIFTIIPVNRGGRGGRFHLIQFTEFGRDVLASYGMTLALGYGRGGIEHQWWAQTITEWLQSNHYESAIEDESMGARVDIGVNAGSLGQVAIEIEISLGNEAHNIRKDLEAGYSAVISLVKERAQLSRLRSLLPVDFPNADVHIGLLPDFSHILSRILEGTSARTPPNQNQEPKNDSPETAPEDPSTPEQHEPAPPQTSQSAPVDVEALLEAVVAGGNLLRRGQGGTKPRRRVPMKQERLLRLLSIYGAVSLDHAIEEFADEWNRIHARRSGDVAKREFFRNMADLASRINDAFAAIRQEQEPGNNTASLQNATFAVIEIKYQSYSLELRFNPEHGGTDPGDGPSPAPPRSVANKNLEDLS